MERSPAHKITIKQRRALEAPIAAEHVATDKPHVAARDLQVRPSFLEVSEHNGSMDVYVHIPRCGETEDREPLGIDVGIADREPVSGEIPSRDVHGPLCHDEIVAWL